MVTPLQAVPTTVPRSVIVAPQQTRSPTFKVLDWSPVIVQTAPIFQRQTEQLFVSACEGLRFLHSAPVPGPASLRRIALPHFRFGTFQLYDYFCAQLWERKHTMASVVQVFLGLCPSTVTDFHSPYASLAVVVVLRNGCMPGCSPTISSGPMMNR